MARNQLNDEPTLEQEAEYYAELFMNMDNLPIREEIMERAGVTENQRAIMQKIAAICYESGANRVFKKVAKEIHQKIMEKRRAQETSN